MRTWGKYLEDRALHFWATKKNDFSGPFSEPLLDLFWTIFDLAWPYLTYFMYVWAGAGLPAHLAISKGYSRRVFFLFFRKSDLFLFSAVFYVFSRKSDFWAGFFTNLVTYVVPLRNPHIVLSVAKSVTNEGACPRGGKMSSWLYLPVG